MNWKKLNSLMTHPLSPWGHRVTHPLSPWGHEHSWVALSGDQTTHSMSMKFHLDSSRWSCSS
jgi:hypothetical protein